LKNGDAVANGDILSLSDYQNISFLANGGSSSATIQLRVSDGNGGSAVQNITINFTGSQIKAVNDTVVLKSSEISGNVLTNDSSTQGVLAVTQVAGKALGGAVNGLYGQLVMAADGDFTYRFDATKAAQAGLKAGQSAQDVFQYQLTDGADNAFANLSVNVTGKGAAPNVGGNSAFFCTGKYF
jgi:large repetitive protein